MSIKPVLRPDHDAADLRDLMNRFSTAAQSATPAAQASRIRQQLSEMDYGGGRSPHAGMGLPRDDLADVDAGKKEIIVKPEAAKKTFKRVGDQLDQAFSQAYNDKDVTEAAIAEDSIRPNLAAALKQLGFKGPFKLGQLPKWMAELQDSAFSEDTSIMIGGNDPEYDPWVAKGYDYGYAYGIETGYQKGLSAREVLNNAKSDIQNIKGVTEGQDIPATVHDINMKMMQLLDKNKQTQDPKEKNKLKLEFQKLKTERSRLLNIDPKDTTTGALDEGGVTESVDPVAQLRADILRFAR